MHIFDLSRFVQSPGQESVTCTQVDLGFNKIPSKRWGHAAATFDNKVYIFGGRNENDVNDIYCFDPENSEWQEIEVQGYKPQPRRRHSAVFISSALVVFGGFDGQFYNDLHIVDFLHAKKQMIKPEQSTLVSDYQHLVDHQETSDITFILGDTCRSRIASHKSLLLYRSVIKELNNESGRCGNQLN